MALPDSRSKELTSGSGFGTGIAQSAVFISLQAAIDPEHKAAAASGLFLTWPIGMTVGLATFSAVMLGVLRKSLDERLVQLHFNVAQREEVSNGFLIPPYLRMPLTKHPLVYRSLRMPSRTLIISIR